MTTGYDMASGDYAYLEELVETVTLTPNTGNGFNAGSAVATVTAIRVAPPARAMMGGDLQWNGPLGVTNLPQIWVLYVETLGGLVPSGGDKITDSDGISWTIVAARKITFGTRWRCVTSQDN